jgi:hypothetical protein
MDVDCDQVLPPSAVPNTNDERPATPTTQARSAVIAYNKVCPAERLARATAGLTRRQVRVPSEVRATSSVELRLGFEVDTSAHPLEAEII